MGGTAAAAADGVTTMAVEAATKAAVAAATNWKGMGLRALDPAIKVRPLVELQGQKTV